ncbi:DmX-like protein 2 [Chionoecetes opilio]|uniref:DmX-like protein 2 n=1 Tax=Chionoecetes opilio TaxID=41210 RepID=A0A8J4XZC5_CHIOP|nr:DmX-like protein 2 [Chionoecetes opilio]
MAQQLKFISCLKMMMEELATLATGCEVDGGQLRYELYVWLEREVEALKEVCDYCCSSAHHHPEAFSGRDVLEPLQSEEGGGAGGVVGGVGGADLPPATPATPGTAEPATLHEIIQQEKLEFEEKLERAARRKRWLLGCTAAQCCLLCEAAVLRNLAAALSACIYQSLCDSETFTVKSQHRVAALGVDIQHLSVAHRESHLVGRETRAATTEEEPLTVCTPPAKWPAGFQDPRGTVSEGEGKAAYREQFQPPEMSIVSLMMKKPTLGLEMEGIDYDSSGSDEEQDDLEEEEEDDVFKEPKVVTENCEHCDPDSYSWCILRLATVRAARKVVAAFLEVAGVEMTELPMQSPLLHSLLRTVDQWIDSLVLHIEGKKGPPPEYIPGCFAESQVEVV